MKVKFKGSSFVGVKKYKVSSYKSEAGFSSFSKCVRLPVSILFPSAIIVPKNGKIIRPRGIARNAFNP